MGGLGGHFILLDYLHAVDYRGITRLRKYTDNGRGDGGDDMSKLVHPTHLEDAKGREWSLHRDVLN
jgi:hypothetical protein